MYAAGVRILTGKSDVRKVVQVGNVVRRVQGVNCFAADRGKFCLSSRTGRFEPIVFASSVGQYTVGTKTLRKKETDFWREVQPIHGYNQKGIMDLWRNG
jgi:hypothetical protein